MCGIVGIVLGEPAADRTRLDAMRDALRHRGPDDAGSWWSPDGRVGLAHRRLAILDLTPGGHQPMADPRGEHVLVFNGEIYNFRELRAELEVKGHRFRSTCDTEVLLAAYRQWGDDCPRKLRGMFAFALYDAPQRRLFLARDRAGEKPLYTYADGKRFAFASELKALMADPDLPRRIDAEALEHYLAYGYVPGSLCMLAGVRKLPAGCAMTYDCETNERKVWRYWNLPEGEPPATADADELTERLRALLRESVRRQLVADVPVGILLSGGIDSSLVTALAAEVSPSAVRTFTISFPGHGAYDEGPYAQQVAAHFGTRHTELEAEPASVDLLPELARQYDEPMADSSMAPTYMVCRLIRAEATVALGGDGGDELFGGYPPHQWTLRMQRRRRLLPAPLRRALLGAARWAFPPGRRGRNYVLAQLADLETGIARINTYFDPPYRRRLLGDAVGEFPSPEEYKVALQQPYATPLRKITAMDFHSFLVDDILVKVDRASMLTSLEVRAPFLDHSIIEFAFSAVPDALRATAREKKILPRRLAAKLLPASMDLKRKQGFMLPLQAWFRGRWGAFCEEVLREAPAALFRPEAVETLLTQQRRGFSHTQRLFALTMFELWRREYNVALPGE